MITVRRALRAANAVMPKWLAVVFTACLVIPGPFDEIAALVVVVFLCAVQPIRFRRARSAWRGGKSHRASDDGRGVYLPESLLLPAGTPGAYALNRDAWIATGDISALLAMIAATELTEVTA